MEAKIVVFSSTFASLISGRRPLLHLIQNGLNADAMYREKLFNIGLMMITTVYHLNAVARWLRVFSIFHLFTGFTQLAPLSRSNSPHVLIRCFKNVLTALMKTKNLVSGKKISAQPTARKKIGSPRRIGVIFKQLVFLGRHLNFKVEIAISR